MSKCNSSNCIHCAEAALEGAESYLDFVDGQAGWGGEHGTRENYLRAKAELIRAQENLEWARLAA